MFTQSNCINMSEKQKECQKLAGRDDYGIYHYKEQMLLEIFDLCMIIQIYIFLYV